MGAVWVQYVKHLSADIQTVRPFRGWLKPWSAANLGGPLLPRRHNGIPYQGVNVLLQWGEAITRGFTAGLNKRSAEDRGHHPSPPVRAWS